MDLAEFFLKMFTVGFLIAGVLGMILQSGAFQGQARIYDNLRLAIDLAHAAAAAPCLAETVDGEVRKGVIDSAKLEEAKANFCVKVPVDYSIKISEIGGKEILSLGQSFEGGISISQPIPVLIKYPGKTVGGVLNAKVRR